MAPPFNPNTTSPAPSDLISAFPTDEQGFRTVVTAWLTFLSDPTTGIINLAALPGAATDIPTGTKMLFVQTAAPTGWVKDTTHNDKALRLVNGTVTTGGTNTFSSTFATINSSAVTLTAAQIPAHTHSFSSITGSENQAHNHGVSASGTTDTQGNHAHNYGYSVGAGGTGVATGNGTRDSTAATDAAGNHAHNWSFSVTSGTENQSHNHNFSGTTDNGTGGAGSHLHTTDLRVQYVDVIICTRS